ncbi:MAG: anthranilate synthase component I [Dehalococcoidia bacterium]|nr:anthranilate synthase component I [Dehalococcoidia bacterium]
MSAPSVYNPSLAEVEAVAGQGNLVPVYRSVPADLETPVSAYLKVAAAGGHSFLLESVEGGENLGRYSFIGTEPYRVLRSGPGEPAGAVDPLVEIERELARFNPIHLPGLPRFTGGAVGYLGYEVARYFERLPQAPRDALGVPEAIFLFVDTLLVFDHLQHEIKVVSHARTDGDIAAAYKHATWRIDDIVARLAAPLGALPYEEPDAAEGGEVGSNVESEEYLARVGKAREHIIAGDIYQVQVSQRFSRETPVHPFAIYRALRRVNPSPYMYYLDFGDMQIVGASPEMLVRVDNGNIESHPIAGTRRRGRDEADERRMEAELREDEKERAEHLMLVDLQRNDLGRVCKAGSVSVTQLMEVEKYSHVMHLVSHVVGVLEEGVSSYDALRASFPAGTVTGAPKIRAMQIIADLEDDRRGPYAGCVGYFDFSGNVDTAITIRTLVIKDGVAHAQAAGGVVYDSEPELEYMECQNKARATLRAIEEAEASARRAPGSLGY